VNEFNRIMAFIVCQKIKELHARWQGYTFCR